MIPINIGRQRCMAGFGKISAQLSGQAGTHEILRDARDRGYLFDLVAKPIHPERPIARLKKSN